MDQEYGLINMQRLTKLIRSRDIIIKFRVLYLKMNLESEVLLDISGLDLPRWFINILFASRTPKHTLSSSK